MNEATPIRNEAPACGEQNASNALSIAALNTEFDAALKGAAKMMMRLREIPGRAFFAAGLIGGHAIETDQQFFTLAEEGEHAVVMPVYDGSPVLGESRPEALEDLVAWFPGQPEKWWVRTGQAFGLGQRYSYHPWLFPQPIHFYRTPNNWLRAGGEGVCIFDREYAWNYFNLIELVAAEDRAHGRELKQLLKPPALPRPEIVVPKAGLEGAL